jgi:hypothetical protein
MVVGGIQQSTKKGTMETAMPLLLLLPLPLLLPSPQLRPLLLISFGGRNCGRDNDGSSSNHGSRGGSFGG